MPVVALVGRPNAGKSTLFNRLVGERRAIVDEQPGVTRDRNVAVARLQDRLVLLVDTGGFDDGVSDELGQAVQQQTWLGITEADVVIAMFDGRAGLNPLDHDFARRLRLLPKPVIYVANKLDDPKLAYHAAEFFALGAEEVIPISAIHGLGVDELVDRVLALLPPEQDDVLGGGVSSQPAVAVAIIGRPNVGKSSLLNTIVGYQRSIVSDRPGTTRDAIDTEVIRGGNRYLLIDTAGVRRRPRVREIIERASVVRAFRAIDRADVAFLLLDALEGMTDQDARLGNYVAERGKALALVFNKWDAVPAEARNPHRYRERVSATYPSFASVPILFISALTGEGVDGLFPLARQLHQSACKQLSTAKLNACLQAATRARPAPTVAGKAIRFYYAVQTGIQPPTFTVFTSHPDHIPTMYQRYLENELRRTFGWGGVPLRLNFRARVRRHVSHAIPASR